MGEREKEHRPGALPFLRPKGRESRVCGFTLLDKLQCKSGN